MDPNAYLQMQGKTREELIEESKPDAERELKREAVLAAIAEAEEIEVSDEEMVEALEHTAEHERTTPEKLLERLRARAATRWSARTSAPARRSTWSPTSAKPIPMAQAEAREKLWTPEKEREQAGSLWTPGTVSAANPRLRRLSSASPATGSSSTGIPFSTALPESGSIRSERARTLLFEPACSRATVSSTPSPSWPQPWGMLTTPGITASVTSTGTSIDPASELTRAGSPSASPRRSASSGLTCAVHWAAR